MYVLYNLLERLIEINAIDKLKDVINRLADYTLITSEYISALQALNATYNDNNNNNENNNENTDYTSDAIQAYVDEVTENYHDIFNTLKDLELITAILTGICDEYKKIKTINAEY
jgi:hypothetical protein